MIVAWPPGSTNETPRSWLWSKRICLLPPQIRRFIFIEAEEILLDALLKTPILFLFTEYTVIVFSQN